MVVSGIAGRLKRYLLANIDLLCVYLVGFIILQVGAAASVYFSAVFVAVVGGYVVLSRVRKKPILRPLGALMVCLGMMLPVGHGIIFGYSEQQSAASVEHRRPILEDRGDQIAASFSDFADAFRSGDVQVQAASSWASRAFVVNDVLGRWLVNASANLVNQAPRYDTAFSVDGLMADRVFVLTSDQTLMRARGKIRTMLAKELGTWHTEFSTDVVRRDLENYTSARTNDGAVFVALVTCMMDREGHLVGMSALPAAGNVDPRTLEGSEPLVEMCRSLSDPDSLPEGVLIKGGPKNNQTDRKGT